MLSRSAAADADISTAQSSGIEAAWAGGRHGREVIDRVLPKLKVRGRQNTIDDTSLTPTLQDLLSPHGVFYMVVVVENKPKEIAAILAKDGFHMTVRWAARHVAAGPSFFPSNSAC